ncbi:hypothetical protein CFC21_004552 [Triticum aestivum]|uniref:Uncharacterized protein n=1 Tax=Triticum aestivum TaxID=4565 RepID=A0A3B5Y7I3_WHEAT|nr:uncharacterized protein LOC123183399 [Triticum aestivum]KAF6986839.1 hypothetical protein CFC21_004552 [Triticum aestivum]
MAAATRILRPAGLPVPGEGLRRLVHTRQNSAPARGSQIQQKKKELYAASQPHWRPVTTAKKVIKWTAITLGAVAVGALATADGQDDWPECHGCGACVPKKCNQCGWNLPRPSAEAIQAASECGQASGAAQNQKETAEVK